LSNSNCERFKLNYPAVNASTPLIRHFSTSSPFHCNKPLSEPIAPLSSLRLRDAFRDPKKIKHQEVLKEGYLPIYQFPYIRFCQLCCRTKVYQSVVVTLAIPYQVYADPAILGTASFGFLVGISSFSLVTLLVMGEFFRRFVGFIYYHPKHKTVRIAHLNFWGHREDALYRLRDITPLTETETNLNQFYIRIKTYTDSRAEFWVNFEKGKVLDRKHFEGIFGSLKSVEHLLK